MWVFEKQTMPKKKRTKKPPPRPAAASSPPDLPTCTMAELAQLMDAVPQAVEKDKRDVAAKRNEVGLYEEPRDQVPVLWDIIRLYERIVRDVSMAGDIALEQTRRYDMQAKIFEKKSDELAVLFSTFRAEVDENHEEVVRTLRREDVPSDVKEQLKTLKVDNENYKKVVARLKEHIKRNRM